MRVTAHILLACSATATLGHAPIAAAATLLVGSSTTADHASLADALAAAADGDTLQLEAGTFTECVEVTGLRVELIGAGSSLTTLDCNTADRFAIRVAEGSMVTVEGLAIRNAGRQGLLVDSSTVTARDADLSELGGAEGGAAVLQAGNLNLEDSVLKDNIGDYGAAVFVDSTSYLMVWNSELTGNFAPVAGGAVFLDGGASLSQEGALYRDNSTGGHGGAVFARPTAIINSMMSTWEGNSAVSDGGALALDQRGSLMVMEDAFTGNESGTNGGAVAVWDPLGLTIMMSAFSQNQADAGGAVHLSEPTGVSIDTTAFTGNEAVVWGGAVAVDTGDLSLSQSSFIHNGARSGAGVAVIGGDLRLESVDFAGNVAVSAGGDVLFEDGLLQLSDVHSTGASAQYGASVAAGFDRLGVADIGRTGRLEVEGSTFTAGRVDLGAIVQVNALDLTLDGCGFTANQTDAGSTVSTYHSRTSVRDTHFTENFGNGPSSALYVGGQQGGLELRDSVFDGNGSADTSAIYVNQVDTVAIADTVVRSTTPSTRGAPPVRIRANFLHMERTRIHAATGGADPALELYSVFGDPAEMTLDAVLLDAPGVGGTVLQAHGPDLDLTLSHVSLLGDTKDQVVALDDTATATIDHTLLAGGHTGVEVAGGASATVSHSTFWDVSTTADPALLGPGTFEADPRLAALTDAAGYPLAVPLPDSPLIDGGDGGRTEADGSVPDIGWTGGNAASIMDLDGDGVASIDDCDDSAPSTHPGADDVPGDGVDSDCDGEDATPGDAADTGAPTPEGDTGTPPEACDPDESSAKSGALLSCSTTGHGVPAGLSWLLATFAGLIAIRRREPLLPEMPFQRQPQ